MVLYRDIEIGRRFLVDVLGFEEKAVETDETGVVHRVDLSLGYYDRITIGQAGAVRTDRLPPVGRTTDSLSVTIAGRWRPSWNGCERPVPRSWTFSPTQSSATVRSPPKTRRVTAGPSAASWRSPADTGCRAPASGWPEAEPDGGQLARRSRPIPLVRDPAQRPGSVPCRTVRHDLRGAQPVTVRCQPTELPLDRVADPTEPELLVARQGAAGQLPIPHRPQSSRRLGGGVRAVRHGERATGGRILEAGHVVLTGVPPVGRQRHPESVGVGMPHPPGGRPESVDRPGWGGA